MTHTYAVLEVPPEAYAAVRTLLVEAHYEHTFHRDGGAEVIDMHGIALRADPALQPQPHELGHKLGHVLDLAFTSAHHPAMLDWAALMFELRRLRREAEEHEQLRQRLSVTVACSSPDGGVELGQVEQAYAERVRLPHALVVLFYVLMRDAGLTSDQLFGAVKQVAATVGSTPRYGNAPRQGQAEELAETLLRALAREG